MTAELEDELLKLSSWLDDENVVFALEAPSLDSGPGGSWLVSAPWLSTPDDPLLCTDVEP